MAPSLERFTTDFPDDYERAIEYAHEHRCGVFGALDAVRRA
ncbi:hypothetical protein [Rhizobium sp. BR 314]